MSLIQRLTGNYHGLRSSIIVIENSIDHPNKKAREVIRHTRKLEEIAKLEQALLPGNKCGRKARPNIHGSLIVWSPREDNKQEFKDLAKNHKLHSVLVFNDMPNITLKQWDNFAHKVKEFPYKINGSSSTLSFRQWYDHLQEIVDSKDIGGLYRLFYAPKSYGFSKNQEVISKVNMLRSEVSEEIARKELRRIMRKFKVSDVTIEISNEGNYQGIVLTGKRKTTPVQLPYYNGESSQMDIVVGSNTKEDLTEKLGGRIASLPHLQFYYCSRRNTY